jgi:carboxymethylenebutenolidase
VHTQWISLPTAGGTMDAYLALPPGGSGPGLLLLQEIFGVNPHIRLLAEQYALAGFVVLAPDVFWRQAPRVELGYGGRDRERGMSLAGALQAPEVLADLQAAVAALRARPEVSGAAPELAQVGAQVGAKTVAKVGVIGYCMGGRLAYTAAALTGVDAAVSYYGGGIAGQLALAAQVRCPMQFHFAGSDNHIPPEAVVAVREAFAGKPAEIFEYPGSAHGFNCWARASYHAPSSALALGRSLTFLAQQLF